MVVRNSEKRKAPTLVVIGVQICAPAAVLSAVSDTKLYKRRNHFVDMTTAVLSKNKYTQLRMLQQVIHVLTDKKRSVANKTCIRKQLWTHNLFTKSAKIQISNKK